MDAGHECFDCAFESVSGNNHDATVSISAANDFTNDNAKVVDAVSALRLIAMLL